jgi:phosphate-selective porin OprO/OprP
MDNLSPSEKTRMVTRETLIAGGDRLKQNARFKLINLSLATLMAALLGGLTGSELSAAPRQSTETYDDIWQFANWYDNDENPNVQSIAFSGRFQYEYANVNGDRNQGSHHEWNVRRLRLGVKTELFREFTLHLEGEFNPQEADPFYMRLTDFYAGWSPSDSLELKFGKQGVSFTMDGQTSSKELLTIDRSNLANNMWFSQEYMPGISLSGDVSNWSYQVGAFSAGEKNREFGRFNGSIYTLVSLGYDFGQRLDVDNTFTRQLQHMTSINFSFEDGRWGFREDLSIASGYLGQSDLWGVMTMPYVNVTSKLQLVARHTYLNSEDPNGVLLARYEKSAVSGRGDRYNELYVGANYYFYGHKLKLQSGLQFGAMNDTANDGGEYSGVAFTTGLRVSW